MPSVRSPSTSLQLTSISQKGTSVLVEPLLSNLTPSQPPAHPISRMKSFLKAFEFLPSPLLDSPCAGLSENKCHTVVICPPPRISRLCFPLDQSRPVQWPQATCRHWALEVQLVLIATGPKHRYTVGLEDSTGKALRISH